MSDFLKAPLFEQIFYFAVKEAEEKRRKDELKSIIKAFAKMHGAKVR